jgi:hypothetical protein
VSSSLQREINKHGRQRWLRMDELPFSRVFGYRLIALGLLDSVLLKTPGSRKGIRLVDGNSLDRALEKLAAEQKGGAA